MRRCIIVTTLVLIACVTSTFAYLERTEPPIILAHRGGAALAPENTLEGWKEVKELCSPDVWELDVHLSEDDSLIVIHDTTIDRTTNGTGRVRKFSTDQIRGLNGGFWFTPDSGITFPWRERGASIPTIAEVFDSFPQDNINIEIKDSIPRAADILVDIIHEKGVEQQVVIGSVYQVVLDRVRKLDPDLLTSGAEQEVRKMVLLEKMGLGAFAKTPMDVLQVPEYSGSIHVVTPGLIRRCHRRGIEVHVWTVNDALTVQRLFEMGVDGIITDRPDMAARVLRTLGLEQSSP